MNKNLAILILGVLLVGAISYIAYGVYQDRVDQREQDFKDGYDAAVKEIVEITSACQTVLPLRYEDKTVNLIAMECAGG